MKLFKIKKAADTTIRQVRTDDKQTVLGIVGVAEDLVSVGLIEQYSGPAGVWIFTSVHGLQHDKVGFSREEALSGVNAICFSLGYEVLTEK